MWASSIRAGSRRYWASSRPRRQLIKAESLQFGHPSHGATERGVYRPFTQLRHRLSRVMTGIVALRWCAVLWQ